MGLDEKGRTNGATDGELDLQRREKELMEKMEKLASRENELERKLNEFKILKRNVAGTKRNSPRKISNRSSIDVGDQSKLNFHTSPELFTAKSLNMIVQAAVSLKQTYGALEGRDSRVSISL